MESFLVEHSLENFCERIWDLADYVVNKRLHEPRIFKVHSLYNLNFKHMLLSIVKKTLYNLRNSSITDVKDVHVHVWYLLHQS